MPSTAGRIEHRKSAGAGHVRAGHLRGWLAVCAAALATTGCTRAGAPAPSVASVPAKTSVAGATGESAAETSPDRLDWLRKRRSFEEFVRAALDRGHDQPSTPGVKLLKVEALLALGRSADAEIAARNATESALDESHVELASESFKRWATARFRQGKPLACVWVDTISDRFSEHEPTAVMLRFWAESLGDRAPFRITGGSSIRATLPMLHGTDEASNDLEAIAATANGVSLSTVFIDTGAQHVLLTVDAATTVGARMGTSGLRLIGFAGLAARPALVETLELGGITLHDVPVLVGDWEPMIAAGGQMALGTELMHHVRFTIDYPARRVLAERGDLPLAAAGDNTWQIPLWTFSQSCLAQGKLADGATARVLIDTGNPRGTYISARWAARHVEAYPRQRGPIVFKARHRELVLDRMDLGARHLERWPVVDTLPHELERSDTVDVLLGRDLLGAYRVTFDMVGRELRLETSEDGPLPANPPEITRRYTKASTSRASD